MHAVLLVRRREHRGAFGPAELTDGVEQHAGEGAAVVGEPGVDAERPVRELVQHHRLGAVATRERDGRAVVLLAVEGLPRALARAQTGDVPEVAVGEALVPPERADDAVDEARARIEARERARGQRRLGQVDPASLRVARAPDRGRFHRAPRYARRSAPPAPPARLRRPMSEAVVEIVGLSKRFGAGVLAVDDLSFTVEQGQVCGLLGPNGAGKTTCLRMLLGLIRPTAGETRLFGEKVHPGTDQLRRLGALIESSSFVPHLSGMRNLRLWWEAGGDKWADADLEQALAIADLGTAIDRRVKTYSQGMRQRLGLARVLLGKPEILVLDEPTNGLDPGEMREVRQLVRRVAEAGSTVLFSSHVLAEVEQICTHAVVMDKGQLVAGRLGRRPDRLGRLGLPRGRRRRHRPAGARSACRRCSGSTTRRPGSRSPSTGPAARSSSLALVQAGVAVETVTARRRLEEAFLGLVEAF